MNAHNLVLLIWLVIVSAAVWVGLDARAHRIASTDRPLQHPQRCARDMPLWNRGVLWGASSAWHLHCVGGVDGCIRKLHC